MNSEKQGKIFIKTFGCQMNEYDSLKIMQILYPEYLPADSEESADIILVNTCSIREKPENKVYSQIGTYKKIKEEKPHIIIGVSGCVAQQEKRKIFSRHPYIDFVLGPQGIYELPKIINKIKKGWSNICHAPQQPDFEIPTIIGSYFEKKPLKAFITIMQGCNNFCSYCIVPYVRGREISRPFYDIITEAKHLLSLGIIDITLIGQNVNSYLGKKDEGFINFSGLLKEISGLEGLKRLRFTTSHPKDLSDDIIDCFRMLPNLCHHLHLPLQSGSDSILKKMNRKYTREHYLSIIKKLVDSCPDISLTTDIIVGFPGETQEDYELTIDMLKKVEYEQLFAFKYSKRPFTMAAKFEDNLHEDIKSDRLNMLLSIQQEIGKKKYKELIGKKIEVLVEGISKSGENELCARTKANQVVNFNGHPSLIGNLVEVTIEKAFYHSLRGSVENSAIIS